MNTAAARSGSRRRGGGGGKRKIQQHRLRNSPSGCTHTHTHTRGCTHTRESVEGRRQRSRHRLTTHPVAVAAAHLTHAHTPRGSRNRLLGAHACLCVWKRTYGRISTRFELVRSLPNQRTGRVVEQTPRHRHLIQVSFLLLSLSLFFLLSLFLLKERHIRNN